MITPDEQIKASLKNEMEKLKSFGASPVMKKEWIRIHRDALRLKYNMSGFEDELFGE